MHKYLQHINFSLAIWRLSTKINKYIIIIFYFKIKLTYIYLRCPAGYRCSYQYTLASMPQYIQCPYATFLHAQVKLLS